MQVIYSNNLSSIKKKFLRNMGQEGALYSEFSIGQVMQQTNLEYVMAYTAPLLGIFIDILLSNFVATGNFSV